MVVLGLGCAKTFFGQIMCDFFKKIVINTMVNDCHIICEIEVH